MAFNIISNITLDMKHAYSVSNIVQVNQYDTAGVIKAQLLNDGAKWSVPQGAKPVVMFKKTDNIGGFYDVTDTDPETAAVSIDTDRSIIYISLDPQTTTTATSNGKYVDMQVAFFENGLRISTFAFYMQVLPSVITSGDLLGSSWIFNILSKEIADTLTVATTPDAMTEWLEENILGQTTGYVIDKDLVVEDAAADAKATGRMVTVSDSNPNLKANKVWIKKTPSEVQIPTVEELDEVKSALNLFNSYNRLEAPTAYKKSSRIEWRKIAGAKMTVKGTSTATSLYDIVPSSMPSWIIPGKTYHIKYNSENVDFRILCKTDPNASSVNILNTRSDADVTIPSDAVSVIIRYVVSSGKTVDETVEAIILNTETNEELAEGLEIANRNIDGLLKDSKNNYDSLVDGNAYNYLAGSTITDKTSGGVTWSQNDDGSVHVDSAGAAATSTSLCDIYISASELPSWVVPGKSYYVEYSSQNVYFRILYKNDPAVESVNILNTRSDAEVTIPSDAVGLIIRLVVPGGTVVDNEDVKPFIWSSETNDFLSAKSNRMSAIVTPYDNPDLFDNFNKSGSQTTTEITWEWMPDGGLHVTGTIARTRFINLYNGNFPAWLTAGKSYYLEYESEYVRFRLLFRRNASDASSANLLETRSNDIITLPDNVATIIIRLAVSADDSGVTVDETVYPRLYEYIPDYQLAQNQALLMRNTAAPAYYDSEIADTLAKIRAASTEPCLTFIWCTDLHYHSVIGATIKSDSVTEMVANMRQLAGSMRFDGLICTGDIVDAKSPATTEETRKQIDYVMEQLHSVGLPMLYVMGNHDDNRYIGYEDSQAKDPFSMAEIYGRFISYAQPDKVTDINDPNGWNYYVDYEQFKIRCFILDSNYFRSSTGNWDYGYSNKTVAWFSAELANVPQGYSVILLSHTSPVQSNNVAGAYVNITNIYNEINAFIQNGGNYICTLYGHSHVDFSNETPWLEITMGSGKAHNFVPDSRYPEGAIAPIRTAGTITEQLFDVLVIKPNSRKIQTIRFGAGVDREWTY